MWQYIAGVTNFGAREHQVARGHKRARTKQVPARTKQVAHGRGKTKQVTALKDQAGRPRALRGAMTSKFLAVLVVLCFERCCP